jgi:hypothetical protein
MVMFLNLKFYIFNGTLSTSSKGNNYNKIYVLNQTNVFILLIVYMSPVEL